MVVGILLGLVANEAVMNVVVTVKQVLGQIITFCVPLIVIGFIAPSITKLGHNASRMLMVALVLAYCSSVGAALASASAGYAIIPHLSIVSQVDGLKELPEVLFQLEIPPLMNVMSALALSLMVGLAITWTKSSAWRHCSTRSRTSFWPSSQDHHSAAAVLHRLHLLRSGV